MKGVILAGGKGTRMWPLTAVTNKHLIPVGDIPMIEYPLHTLNCLDLESISIVTGGENFQDIAKYLSETHPNQEFSYHYQKEAGGIAQAMGVTRGYLEGNSRLAVILGDNIFEDNCSKQKKMFEEKSKGYGAFVFLKKVKDPQRFGVVEIKNGKIISIEEKPKNPKSDFVTTGLYFYDSSVFGKINRLKPSNRGELEITDINMMYLREGGLGYSILEGFWSDAGTIESRQYCEKFVKKGLENRIIKSNPGLTLK